MFSADHRSMQQLPINEVNSLNNEIYNKMLSENTQKEATNIIINQQFKSERPRSSFT